MAGAVLGDGRVGRQQALPFGALAGRPVPLAAGDVVQDLQGGQAGGNIGGEPRPASPGPPAAAPPTPGSPRRRRTGSRGTPGPSRRPRPRPAAAPRRGRPAPPRT